MRVFDTYICELVNALVGSFLVAFAPNLRHRTWIYWLFLELELCLPVAHLECRVDYRVIRSNANKLNQSSAAL